MRFTPKEMKLLSFSAEEFRVAGFTAPELRGMGLLPKELKEGGFTLEEIKHAGYTVWQLRENFPAWMLIGKLRPPGNGSNGQASARSPKSARNAARVSSGGDPYASVGIEGGDEVASGSGGDVSLFGFGFGHMEDGGAFQRDDGIDEYRRIPEGTATLRSPRVLPPPVHSVSDSPGGTPSVTARGPDGGSPFSPNDMEA